MVSAKLTTLPALRRQHLLAEFAGLKQACPEGVFMSLTPGDLALWSGVIFVRKGPYETAILRFQISFPDTYPRLPPLVTFSTDIFHPLITPLTTYMYTTDIHDNGTVSATDEERLPPGGFSLRHGFPDWFGRGAGRKRHGQDGSRVASGSSQLQTPPRAPASGTSRGGTPVSNLSSGGGPQRHLQTEIESEGISTYEVLRYISSTFDDAAVLDSVPLEAAGNPGAWHAWKTRQSEAAVAIEPMTSLSGPRASNAANTATKSTEGVSLSQELGADGVPELASSAGGRRPGEWNWEGVWEERVKRGIAASLSEPVLFGNAGGAAADDVIRFVNMEKDDVEAARQNLLKTLGPSP